MGSMGPSPFNIITLLVICKYSSVDRLFYVTAFALRFVSNLKLSVQKQNLETNYLITGEFQKAENIWIKSVQERFAKNNSNIN